MFARERALICGVGIALFAAAPSARAEPRDLRWSGAVDGVVLGVGAAAWLAGEILVESRLAPASCRWCAVDVVDGDARQVLRWSDPATAAVTSDVFAFGLAPISAALTLGLAANNEGSFSRTFGPDMLIVGEAVVLAMDLDQLTKFAVARERPYMHAAAPSEKDRTRHPEENNLSFFSGHTTATFALAAAAGTVASMRGYRSANLTWATGGVLAFGTGYLRIAADKHWLTDVVAGMVVGTAVGVVVPSVFHSPRSEVTATDRVAPPSSVPVGPTFATAW